MARDTAWVVISRRLIFSNDRKTCHKIEEISVLRFDICMSLFVCLFAAFRVRVTQSSSSYLVEEGDRFSRFAMQKNQDYEKVIRTRNILFCSPETPTPTSQAESLVSRSSSPFVSVSPSKWAFQTPTKTTQSKKRTSSPWSWSSSSSLSHLNIVFSDVEHQPAPEPGSTIKHKDPHKAALAPTPSVGVKIGHCHSSSRRVVSVRTAEKIHTFRIVNLIRFSRSKPNHSDQQTCADTVDTARQISEVTR